MFSCQLKSNKNPIETSRNTNFFDIVKDRDEAINKKFHNDS